MSFPLISPDWDFALWAVMIGIAGFGLLARSLSLEVFGEWVLFITGGSFVEMFRFVECSTQ